MRRFASSPMPGCHQPIRSKTLKYRARSSGAIYDLDSDFVFSGDLLDPDHIEKLREQVSAIRNVAGVAQCLLDMDRIIECLRLGTERPSDKDLCRRYADREIDVRTVIHITGWSPVELYNKCVEFGYEAPSFGE